MSNIHNFDLNLLRVFDALMEERSVTKAGARLSITQSAVSHALGKMRASIGDVLFMPGSGGMHPTPRALELAQFFTSALRQVDMALLAPRFDPQTVEIEFAISTSDYATSTLFPLLLKQLEAEAPDVRIWLRPNSDVDIVEELERGTLHLAMGAFGKAPQRFQKTMLTTEPWVWVMRNQHPAALEPMTVMTIAAYRHIDILISRRDSSTASDVVNQDGLERPYITSNPAYLDGLLARSGLRRRIGATVSHFLAVPPLLTRTDMIAFVPLSVARAAEHSYGLIRHQPPYPAPQVEISMLTHRTMGAHPSIAWLRQKLQSVVDAYIATS